MSTNSTTEKDPATNKATELDTKPNTNTTTTKKTLEEDDEFEDFPIDTWSEKDTLKNVDNIQTHLWVENWDDVEVDDDFTNALKNELERYKQEETQ
ncbi:proteasome regulatory particle lid subunit SEM1 NDAI_0B05610 [Naumovozyma dairenensis CBS 421]|uniref:26S proteasome complex subunit SEM1 n=1 Tax=Naumovozyma dairenensis (strain ATCC 10597 / BCRC 20456 / CBS 421 / NBRC 0211 / NRRL Y-12639) TaxID=1071378 RepID=G0W733_NAUDC|nr:hypothetical protein NDAI_0B05610 [Naumovozyma dairenensis CBS 421]CCD23594.1 hypothetical protein NDAI_0B05610 [Naumovozyma dairenensis CBS 421]